MSFNNGLVRHRGSRSAIQAILASANNVQEQGNDIESIGTFDNVRVLNNPDTESYDITSSDGSRNGPLLFELQSEELAILSTESSSSSEANQPGGDNRLIYSISPSNSQRIDEWCMDNEINRLTEDPKHLLTSLRMQDMIHSWGVEQPPLTKYNKEKISDYKLKGDPCQNYTSRMLQGLNEEQLFKVKQFTKELLPLLRNSRRSHSAYTHRFPSIPSVFPQRDLVLAYSLQYNEPEYSDTKFLDKFSSVYLDDTISISSQGNSSWLSWTVVPRLTDHEL